MAVAEISLSNALFSSVQQRLLALIFGNPERSFYVKQIMQLVQSGTGAVDRELDRLQRSGLVSMERVGNQKHYRANRQSPIFDEIYNIVQKTFGLSEPIRRALKPYADKIKAAFVYGSVAKGTDTARSDIDLMIIGGGLTYADLFDALQKAEQTIGRPVNPTFLSVEDWQEKLSQKQPFVSKINNQSKLFVIGSEEDLKQWAIKS